MYMYRCSTCALSVHCVLAVCVHVLCMFMFLAAGDGRATRAITQPLNKATRTRTYVHVRVRVRTSLARPRALDVGVAATRAPAHAQSVERRPLRIYLACSLKTWCVIPHRANALLGCVTRRPRSTQGEPAV